MIWPFPLDRNYKTNSDLSELFLAFASAPMLEFHSDVFTSNHYIAAKCHLGTLRFWIANRYYAYAQVGTYTSCTGKVTEWKDELPSRWAVRRMVKAINNDKRAKEDGRKFKWTKEDVCK